MKQEVQKGSRTWPTGNIFISCWWRVTLCFVCLPTSQGMQWGQRSFEIDFKVLVIFVDVWFKTRLAFEKEHLIGVRKKSVGGPRCLSGVHWIYQGPPKVCRGPNKGPSGVLWDPLGGILGSIRASLGGLLVTKFGELIWTALQIEKWWGQLGEFGGQSGVH